MTTRKQSLIPEPLLNNVARTLGHAAGTLTKVTQELTENLSALPETVSRKVREAAGKGADRPHAHTRHSGKKKVSRAAHAKKAKVAAGAKKRSPPKRKATSKGPRGPVRAR
jgi:hypothetical protein